MSSIALKEEMTTASAELRSAVERLKITREDGTDEEIKADEKKVEEARKLLLSTVTKISKAQDEIEKSNPSSANKNIPVETVTPTTPTPTPTPTTSSTTENIANVQMTLDSSQYHSIKVVPKLDEINDSNFPPSLLAAMELFSKLKMLNHGRELQNSVETFCTLLESGPPVNAVSMGVACVCWTCGHCGLPLNVAETTKAAPATASKEELSKVSIAARCSKCGSDLQTNLIRVTQPDGTMIPWIESKEEQKKKAEEARKNMMEREGSNDDPNVTKVNNGGKKKHHNKKVKPNEKCPCGSGKKFKKCCK
jgi:hypothetical protein